MNEVENMKNLHLNELTELKEKLLEDNRSRIDQKDNDKINIMNELNNKIEELSQKLENLKNEKTTLENEKVRLESSERDLIGRNSIISTELKVYREDVETTRMKLSEIEKTVNSQEKTIGELNIKNDLLNKQLEEKEKNVQNLSNLVGNLNNQKTDIDDNIRSIKNNNTKLEDKLQASINEINKGNEIIKKLQDDIKGQKQKMKLKQQAYTTQETLLGQRQNQIDDLTRGLNDLKRDLERKDDELKNVKLSNEDLKNKLEEASNMIADNQRVIEFLNKTLTKAREPLTRIMKSDTDLTPLNKIDGFTEGLQGINNNNMNTPNVFNTTNSSANKYYFNSNAFQTQGSVGKTNENFIMPFTRLTTPGVEFKSDNDIGYNNSGTNTNGVNTGREVNEFKNTFSSSDNNVFSNNINPIAENQFKTFNSMNTNYESLSNIYQLMLEMKTGGGNNNNNTNKYIGNNTGGSNLLSIYTYINRQVINTEIMQMQIT